MKKGDLLELEIVSSGMNGEGVAKIDGQVIFVPLTLVGEIVKVEIVEVKKNFARAKVVKIISPSSNRIKPLCPVFFKCGGCEMQHINYQTQLSIKKQNIYDCIKKQCAIECAVNDVISAEDCFGYRNKIQVPIQWQGDKVVAGYYKPSSHIIVPFGQEKIGEYGNCPLHNFVMQDIIDIFCSFVQDNKITTYSESWHKGLIRHLVIRKVGQSSAIVIVINGRSLPCANKLIDAFIKYGLSFSLFLSHNIKRTNVIMSNDLTLLYGQERLNGEVLGVKFQVSPLSFMQINDCVRDLIYNKVNDIISATPNSVVIDAYSGIGILSNVMAKSAKKVVAIEIVEEAIQDANHLAHINNNKNKISNICGDSAVEVPRILEQELLESHNNLTNSNIIVVLDPPRKGCDANVINAILHAKPNQIIYISCNPATLARDLEMLLVDYTIDFVQPYDMFPQTGHVETLICLSKKS